MKFLIFIVFFISSFFVNGQTTTNSSGNGNFDTAATWTNPIDLTNNAIILNSHTITVPANTNIYANKITFEGTGKLLFSNSKSKWLPASSLNANPNFESFVNQNNWSTGNLNRGFNNEAFGQGYNGQWHYTSWIDSDQAWSAPVANNKTDFLQYDLQSVRWIQGIVTQGRANSAQWVRTAKVEVSVLGTNDWVTVSPNLGFTLNTDQNTKVYNNFPRVMFGRYVKVTPIEVYGHASMRLGILLRDFNLLKSCKEIKDANPDAVSGVYSIDPDGPTTNNGATGTQPSTSCYCDMDTDGGGWTLVLNYLHKKDTYSLLNPKSKSLPLLGSSTLVVNESSSVVNWGHATPSYFTSFPFTEVRFYGKTSSHTRVIHFKTVHAGTISYFRTGIGSMSGIQTVGNFTTLSGHNSYLPANAIYFFSNQGINAMTYFPFYSGTNPNHHWGISGENWRWEVDDIGGSNDTHHQIWIR